MSPWTPQSNLAKAVVQAGFLYDPAQDIICSSLNAPQHALGYCWAYDQASALVEMIIDCETFYFIHKGDAWLIELWKGQYGIETGCEIGVYRDGPFIEPLRPDFANFRSRFYKCVERNQQQMLPMQSALYSKGKPLLHRHRQYHFWLGAWKWGIFTENTHDLAMRVQVDFPSAEMCAAFRLAALLKNYSLSTIGKQSVAFTFQVPHTRQPASRAALEEPMQAMSKMWVEKLNQYKQAHNITNNDPNRFTFSQYEAPAEQLAASASARAGQAAAAAAKNVEHGAALASSSIHREASHFATAVHQDAAHVTSAARQDAEHAASAVKSAAAGDLASLQRKIFAFFGNKRWHCAQHSKRAV